VKARFPVDWDVHQWEGLALVLHAQRAFSVGEVEALNAAVQRAVRDWNTREANTIDYLGEPERDPNRTWIRWYLDLGVAGADVLVETINALDVIPAANAIARCSVGQRG
jgi:hypothetical protein